MLNFDFSITKRGYTGHEQMDELGLIHMNGRVYDPKLARFLQADPIIQAASNTQSYNRYSYVWNNPLNATDPSGYSLKKLWNEIRPFVGVIVAVAFDMWCVCGTVLAGMVGGFAGGAANSSSFSDMMMGAMIGGLTGAAGGTGNLFAMGIAGGLSAAATGGNLYRGFLSAGIGGAFGAAEGFRGFVRATVLGGVTSEITGGKFKNGAATAAFSWALAQTANTIRDTRLDSAGSSVSHLSEAEQDVVRKELALAVEGVERTVFDSADLAAKALHEAVSPIAKEWGIEIGAMIHDARSGGNFHLSEGSVIVGDVTTDFLSGSVDIRSLSGFDRVASYQVLNCVHIANRNMGHIQYIHEVGHILGFRHRNAGLMHPNATRMYSRDIEMMHRAYLQ